MRDAVGSTWIFAIVMAFTLIFSGFLVLALSYSKAYRIKNEMTSVIEKYEGLTTNDSKNNLGSIGIINLYLKNSAYNAVGHCEVGDYAVDDLEINSITKVTESNVSEKYYYCVTLKKQNNCYNVFRITVFYNFNLPIFGKLKQYSISGQTNEIYNAYINDQKIKC